jgi:N-acetylmuramoyl-L-alanine amidase
MALDLKAIKQHGFPTNQFVKEEYPKSQIVLHHTVSGEGVTGDVNHWLRDPKRIATCILIAHDGVIHQCFSSKYWGYHLGIKRDVFREHEIPYQRLDKTSIGIEIDSYGGLKEKDGKWYNVYDYKAKRWSKPIPDSKVVKYPNGYRGYYAFEKYTKKQIQAVEDLLIFWHERYGIPLDYNEDMFDVSVDALKGKAGVWSHTSFRDDKSDIHPQKDLIKMLKGLKAKVEGSKKTARKAGTAARKTKKK